MKKVFLSLALVAAMSVSFVSCKEKAEEGTEVETTTEEVVEEPVMEEAPVTEEAPATEEGATTEEAPAETAPAQ